MGTVARYGAVMVPCEVPAPQHERLSLYKSLLSGFYLSEAVSVVVVVPGRRSKAVCEGFRYALREMRLRDVVAVALRKGNVFLVRRSPRSGPR